MFLDKVLGKLFPSKKVTLWRLEIIDADRDLVAHWIREYFQERATNETKGTIIDEENGVYQHYFETSNNRLIFETNQPLNQIDPFFLTTLKTLEALGDILIYKVKVRVPAGDNNG